jgi:hypothetical protein
MGKYVYVQTQHPWTSKTTLHVDSPLPRHSTTTGLHLLYTCALVQHTPCVMCTGIAAVVRLHDPVYQYSPTALLNTCVQVQQN